MIRTPELVPTRSAPAAIRSRTCCAVLMPAGCLDPICFGASFRRNRMSSGVATPTAPPLAFFKYLTPASMLQCDRALLLLQIQERELKHDFHRNSSGRSHDSFDVREIFLFHPRKQEADVGHQIDLLSAIVCELLRLECLSRTRHCAVRKIHKGRNTYICAAKTLGCPLHPCAGNHRRIELVRFALGDMGFPERFRKDIRDERVLDSRGEG